MRQYLRALNLCLALLLVAGATAQDTEDMIFLRNPSFEDMPRNSQPPRGWTNCGFPGETPPDVQPDPKFEFRVSKPAFAGNTYLGMVTRENETYESVGQQLGQPMKADQCYEFRVHLARSEVYLSRSRKTNQPSNYVTPIKLRIFGGYSICDRGELIGESALVDNYDWQEYRFEIKPGDAYTHIILEAYYKQPIMFPYNGNVLVDNAQPLRPINCGTDLSLPYEEPLDAVTITDPDEQIQVQPVVPRSGTQPSPANPVGQAPPKEPTVRLGRTEATLKEGQVFAIENITFKANSAELEEASEDALQEIVGFLQDNDDIIVEIGGHASRRASSTFANDLSTNRAKTVVSYLKTYNIGFERMLPKGYGKNRPVCTSNDMECNRRNQRVEVKILKIRSK